MKKQLISLIVVSLFFVTTLGMLQYASFPSSASAPSSSISNSVYVNGTLSGYQSGSSTLSQQTLTIDGSYSDQLVQVSNSASSPTWSLIGSTQTAYTFNLGTVTFLSGQPVSLNSFIFAAPVDDNGEYDIGSGLTAVLSINGNTYTYTLPSSDYFISTTDPYFIINPSWTVDISGTYSVSMKITVTASYAIGAAASGGETTGSTSTGGTTSYPGGVPYVVLTYFYAYSSTSSNSYTPSLPTGSQDYQVVFSSVSQSVPTYLFFNGNNVQTGIGIYTTGTGSADPIKLVSGSFNAAYSSYTGTVEVENVVQSASDIINNTAGVSQNPTQNINWWNSTFSASFSPPSGWLNGNSLDGKTWNTVLSSYTVQHILSAGQDATTTPNIDYMELSSNSYSNDLNPPSMYNSYTVSPNIQDNSGVNIAVNVNEFINYKPQITVPPAATFSGSGSQMTFEIGTSEFNSSMKETVNVQWGDGATSSVFNHQPGLYTFTHSYTSTGTYTIQATVTNQPNGDPVSPSALSSSSSALYIITVTPNPSPSPNLPLNTGQAIWLNFTQSNVKVSTVTLSVNGLGVSPVEHSSTSYSYLSSSAGISTVNAVWTLTGGSLTYTYSVAYASKVIPSNLSRSVSVLFSDNATHSYPITLSGVPQEGQVPITITNSQSSATGVYQQLINFPTSTYKNSINANFSDVYFAYANGTTIPSWIESNASNTYTTTPIWMKLNSIPASSSITVYAHIVPNSVFFGQKWADIGEADTPNDNGKSVFPAYISANGNGVTTRTFNGATYAMAQYNSTNLQDIGNISGTSIVSTFLGVNLYDGGSTAGYNLHTPISNTNRGGLGLGTNSFRNTSTAGWTSGFWAKGGQLLGNGPSNYNYYTLQISSYSNLTWWGADTYANTTTSLYSNVTLDNYNNQPFYEQNMSGQSFTGQAQIVGNFYYAYIFVRNAPNDVYAMPSAVVSTTMQSSNDTQQYYQQLITISTATTGHIPSYYGLNSADSNFQIATSSGTPLYTWIQSGNQSSLTFWTKTPYTVSGTETLQMEVMPYFENLFSANGYLRYNSTLIYANATDYTTLPNNNLINSDNPVTVSLNFETTDNAQQNFFDGGIANSKFNAFEIGLAYGNQVLSNGALGTTGQGIYFSNWGNDIYFLSPVNLTNGESHSLALTLNSRNVSLWIDGTPITTAWVWNGVNSTVTKVTGTSIIELPYTPAIDGQSILVGHARGYIWSNGNTYLTGNISNVNIFNSSVSTMPTASISGSGSDFMANSSQINHPNYQSMAPTGSDLSSGYYQYNVPDYYNSAYATVFYNSSWEFYSASPQTWVLGTSGGMDWIFFTGLTNSGTISFVLKEPIQIANPVGTMSVTYAPSSSVNGLALFNLPTSLLTLKANGVEVNPSGFQVVVGKPVSLQVLTTSGSLVYNKTFTPTALQDYEALAVNISSITFMNENMSQVVSVSVSSGNTTQNLAPIMPLETSTVYIPSGSYTWTFQSLNLTTGAVEHSITATSTLNGLDWQIFTGLTFLDVKNTEIQQANNISSVLRTVNINVLAGQNTTLIVNTTVNALNGSFKNLNLNETTFFTTLNSTMNNANVTITSDVAIVNSLVKTLNLKMLQSFAQVYGETGQIYEVYSLLNAMNNYVQSQGTGILQPKASEVAASFSTQVDPLEVIQGSSYANDTANLSANYTNLWISNPINGTAFNSVLASTIHSQLTLNEIGPSSAYKLAVNYYTLKSGKLLLIHRDWYNNSAQLVQLNPSYIADGYVVDLNFSGYTQATGQQMYFQEYTTWSGSMNFDWTLNNNTKTYSDSFAVPGEQGFWNNILMSSVQSISHSQEFNMSSVMQNVIMGFPTSVTVNPASITLKDLTAGTTLTEGSNYYGSGTGIQFTTFNDTEHKYYATFQPVQNVTVGNTIPLSLGAPTQTYLGQKEVYLATALYINTGGSQTANFILSVTQNQNVENATVMVNGQIWPSNEVSFVGNQIVVDNVHMTPGESVSIKVYYSLAAPLTVYSALFFPLISGLMWLTPWFFVGVSLLVVLGIVVRNRKGKKETLYRGELGIIFLGFLVWFIVMMMHLQGAI